MGDVSANHVTDYQRVDPILRCGYGSIPVNTIFRGMNIHLPAILMFTRGTRFWPTAMLQKGEVTQLTICQSQPTRRSISHLPQMVFEHCSDTLLYIYLSLGSMHREVSWSSQILWVLGNHNWLVVWNMNFMTFHILGMSSSQLTNSYFSEG